MSQNETHIIRRQVFELTLADASDPLRLQERLPEIFKKKLIQRVAHHFSDLGPADMVIRIDRLELNLGTIRADRLDDFLSQLNKRLDKEVARVCQKIREKKKIPEFKGGKELNLTEEGLELFRVFLEKGRLPWWAMSLTPSPDAMAQELLKSQPDELQQLLAAQLRSSAVLKRLIRQLSPASLRALLALRLDAAGLAQVMALLPQGKESAGQASARPSLSPSAYASWEKSFQHVFVTSASDSLPALIRKLKKEISASPKAQDTRNAPELEEKAGVAPPAEAPPQASPRGSSVPEVRLPAEPHAIAQLISFFLINGKLPPQLPYLVAEQLENFLQELIKTSPARLKEVVEDILPHDFALDRLLYQFSPELIYELLAALSGKPKAFWEDSLRELASLLKPSMDGQQGHHLLQKESVKYLGKLPGKGFDEWHFLRHVLKVLDYREQALPPNWAKASGGAAWLASAAQQIGGTAQPEAPTVAKAVEMLLVYLQKGQKDLGTFFSRPAALLDWLLQKGERELIEGLQGSLPSPSILSRFPQLFFQPPMKGERQLFKLLQGMSPALEGQIGGLQEPLISFLATQSAAPDSERVKVWLWRVLLLGAMSQGESRSPQSWAILLLDATAKLVRSSPSDLKQAFAAWADQEEMEWEKHPFFRVWDWPLDEISPDLGQRELLEIPFEALEKEIPAEKAEGVEKGKAVEGKREEGEFELLEKILLKKRTSEGKTGFSARLVELLQRSPRETRMRMATYLQNPILRRDMLSLLTESAWKQLKRRLRGADRQSVESLLRDLRFVLQQGIETKGQGPAPIRAFKAMGKEASIRLLDEALLSMLFSESKPSADGFLRIFLPLAAISQGSTEADFLFALRQAAEQHREKVELQLSILLGRMAKRRRKHHLPSGEGKRKSRRKAQEQTPADPMADAVIIRNAGAVILAPFLPRYFQILGLRTNQEFVDASAQERAVHLLQYLITGRTESPEHELLLNKVLCGLAPEEPISRGIELQENEKAVSEQLLKGVIQNWSTIKRSSVAALRETFLMREGLLAEKEENWLLKVSEGPFDMVLDTLPWSISMIKMSWMEKILQVEWR
jgi:hypothetical protein